MSDVLVLGNGLLSTIAKAIELWNQRNQNAAVLEELKQFVKDLEENIGELQKKAIGCSNSTAWALDALQKDLENADLDAKNILNKGFIRSVWNANKTQSKIQALRERVMTSFQSRLLFVTLDVVIEGKQEQDAFQEAMLNVNTKLMDLYCSNSEKSVQEVLRNELKQVLQPVMVALKSHGERIENAMLTISKTEPQTSEAEKFFADVLAGLEGISKEIKEEGSSSKGNANKGSGWQSLKWYQDPITWEKMCDPVKATDGHTYDRWTILRNASGMARSPFLPGDQRPFHIAIDDIDVRSRLFHKFPEQEEKFRAERIAYRDAALQAADVGHLGQSLMMLDHVLQWDPHDTVCCSKRDQVHLLILGNNVVESSELFVQNMEAGRSLTEQDLSSSSDEPEEEEKTGTHLDEATVSPREVALSKDGLQATYKRDNTRNATGVVLYANLPCPSDCYPFYYFEMEVSKDDMQRAHVGIGFSSTKEIGQNSSVVDSAHPDLLSGYQAAVPGAVPVVNLDREDGCLVSVARGHFRGGDTVGAGFHTSTGNVFFTRNGQVVALVESRLDNVRPFHLVFPTVLLKNYGAKVKLNFGHGRRGFLEEPLPTRLERTTCDPNMLYLSRNGLSLRLMARADGRTRRSGTGAIMADKPVPVRTALFYFEITVADPGDNGLVGLGFSGKSSFCKDEMPGWYNNSCAYHGGDGKLYQAGGEGTPFGAVAVAGDTMGAGIHHGNNEIFFVKNGVLIATVRNTLTDVVTPVVGLGSSNGQVTVDFNGLSFHAEARPSRLVVSPSSSKLVDLTPDGLTTCYVGQRRPRAHDHPELPVAALQANHVACFHSCDNYYFELTVVKSGESGRIAIGFTHQNHFQADKQPGWYPNSCGYHGDDGMLYSGTGLIGEKFGPTFSAGDTVGAGIDNESHVIFFVKNGELVGQHKMQLSCALSPIIGLHSPNEEVRLNFGHDLFLFDTNVLRLSAQIKTMHL